MRLQLESLKLTKQLQDKAKQFANRRIAGLLQASDDIAWWYYQEFGTATRFDPGDYNGFVPPSTAPGGYEIHPVNAQAILLPATSAYPQEAIIPYIGPPFTALHPGVVPKMFVRRILPQIDEQSTQALASALVHSGYDPQEVKDVLLQDVLPAAKQAIVSSIAESLNQNRPDGKLEGVDPATTFEAGTTITDI